jgi:DNA-binding beta-propeller fold protein YncE
VLFRSEGSGPGEFVYPVAVCQDGTENLYVAEYGSNDRVQKFGRDGACLLAFGGFGTEAGNFQRPSGLVWRDGRVYVADAINNRIQVFADDGRFVGVLAPPGRAPAALHFPYDLAPAPDGGFHVVEYGAGRLTKLGPDGALLGRFDTSGTAAGPLRTPWGLAGDAAGRIWIADTGNRRIVELVP